MKKTSLLIILVVLFFQIGISQTTTIVNYDFNSSSSYPLSPSSTASGITCSASSSEPFQTYTGVATTTVAFVQNTTAGNALAMSNSSGTNTRYFLFQLGGSDLNTYQSYKLYMQPQRSTTGATLVTVAYSTNGSSYTNLSTTYPVTASFSDMVIDLSSISAINNSASLYIKLMVSGTTAPAGTIRIDNFQIQATKGTTGGGSNPWQVTGNDIGFTGKVGIGTASPAFPLDVTGEARISSNLQVAGNTTVNGEMNASALSFGETANKVGFTTAVMPDGARVMRIGNGPFGPIQIPPTTCMKSFITGDLQQSHRFTITTPPTVTSSNMLDMTNDGTNGFIDYGFDINQFQVFDPNNPAPPRPALKLNSVCWGDVEIAKGGGFASTGNYFEVGNPVRNGGIASNINGGNKVGQRITVSSPYPESYPTPPAYYNSQLFVNRSKTRALAVFNTATNAGGDETFSVYGDGKTQINAGVKANKYFVVNDVSTANAPNESFVVYGDGKTEIRVNSPSATPDVFNVYDVQNSKVQFRIKSTGFVYAREVEIQTGTFPDYVFAKEYKRLSLPQLENYINTNKHLPNFENADYYINNGIKTSEMFVKQQETIENLTLYIIELEKRLKALEESTKH